MKIKKEFKKIISLLLVIGLNWAGLLAIGQTRAYFSDTETSENNIMAAGILDFELYSAADFLPEIASGVNSTRVIQVIDYFSAMNYNYRVRVENPVGDLCAYLFLEDNISGALQQPLANFISNEVLYLDKDEWIFTAFLDTTNPGWEGKVCNFDLVYEGWQNNMNFGEGGFSDVEKISNLISNGDQPIDLCMKINEVYYDPGIRQNNAGKFEDDPEDEWIELYNSCDYSVNLKDWYLEDNGGYSRREDLNHDYLINPGQFVVIAANASTWAYWPNIPSNAFKIALGGNKMFSYGLSNSGDVIILYDDQGNQIDKVSWGTDFTGLNPPVIDVIEGHSISRKVKGVDTDSNLDWMDTYSGSTPPGPNPGTNPHTADGKLLLPPTTNSVLKPIPEQISIPEVINGEEKKDEGVDDIEIIEDEEMKNEKNEIEIKIDDDNSDEEENDDDDDEEDEDEEDVENNI